jgi:hypothetical protein
MGLKVGMLITGAKQFRFRLQLAVPEVRSNVRAAVVETTEAVVSRARANVPVSDAADRKAQGRPGPGELRNTIRGSFTLDGMMGFVLVGNGKLARRSKAARPRMAGPLKLSAFLRQEAPATLRAQRELGVYAMVVNYGSPGRGIPGSRFLDRARESERANHIGRIRRATRKAVAAVSTSGTLVGAGV